MLDSFEHPDAGQVDTLGFQVKRENIDTAIERHPPLLGEHMEEILRAIGDSDSETESLVTEETIDRGD